MYHTHRITLPILIFIFIHLSIRIKCVYLHLDKEQRYIRKVSIISNLNLKYLLERYFLKLKKN